jgi:hypothetical protein
VARAVAGGLPGAVLLAVYQHFMYGSVWRTGYGNIGDSFSHTYAAESLTNYLTTLPWALPLAVVAILGLPFFHWGRDGRVLLALALWIGVLAVFFAFYFFTHLTWWYLRFLLPAFPALVILGLLGCQCLYEKLPQAWERWARSVIAGLVVLTAVAGSLYAEREHHVSLMKEYQQPYVEACVWARENLPQDTLIAAMQLSSALYFYTDFSVLRWDLIPEDSFVRLTAELEKSKRPFYAMLFPFEQENERIAKMKLLREQVAEVNGVGIWKCVPMR